VEEKEKTNGKEMVKKKSKTSDIVLIILFVISMALIYSILAEKGKIPSSVNIFTLPDLSTVGYVEVEPDVSVQQNTGIVTLTGDCYELTANTDPIQAQSIANGLTHTIPPRPGTHDLMKDMLENLNIKVVMVKVIDLRDKNYIGRLILQQENNVLSLDTRPSDGIALALRTNSSIYVKEDLLKANGKYIC